MSKWDIWIGSWRFLRTLRQCRRWRGAEERTLAEIAVVLAEVTESVACCRGRAREAHPGTWMDSEQAAAYLAVRTQDSFEKISAKTDISKHRLTERVILYNRAELDAWLMGR